MIYFNNRDSSSGLTRRLILFRCNFTTKAQGLEVLGEGRERSCFSIYSKGT